MVLMSLLLIPHLVMRRQRRADAEPLLVHLLLVLIHEPLLADDSRATRATGRHSGRFQCCTLTNQLLLLLLLLMQLQVLLLVPHAILRLRQRRRADGR